MFLWPPTTTTRLRRFPGAYLVAKVRLLKKWRCIAVSIRPTRKSHQVNSIRKVKTTTTQYHKQAVRRITTSSAYLTLYIAMLCTFCETLDFDAACSKQGAAHHENWSDLRDSAEAGCELCIKVFGSDHATLNQQASKAHAIHSGHEKIRCFYDNDNSWLFWASHPYKLVNRIRSIHVCTANGTFFALARPESK